ncbi:MAG: hypothetical protein R3C49_00245 [Planctomycetaceae bacterium]
MKAMPKAWSAVLLTYSVCIMLINLQHDTHDSMLSSAMLAILAIPISVAIGEHLLRYFDSKG